MATAAVAFVIYWLQARTSDKVTGNKRRRIKKVGDWFADKWKRLITPLDMRPSQQSEIDRLGEEYVVLDEGYSNLARDFRESEVRRKEAEAKLASLTGAKFAETAAEIADREWNNIFPAIDDIKSKVAAGASMLAPIAESPAATTPKKPRIPTQWRVVAVDAAQGHLELSVASGDPAYHVQITATKLSSSVSHGDCEKLASTDEPFQFSISPVADFWDYAAPFVDVHWSDDNEDRFSTEVSIERTTTPSSRL